MLWTSLHNNNNRRSKSVGFSLVEVVVAVGIFAVAISIVVGLLSSSVATMTNTIDRNAAGRLTSALNSRLQLLLNPSNNSVKAGYESVQSILFPSSVLPDSVSLTDIKLLYANKEGDKIGTAADPIWGGANNHAEQFFEIMLVRSPNITLSGTDADGNNPASSRSAFVMFTARVSWPAYLPNGTATGFVGPTPRQERSVFLFNSAIAR